MRLSRIHCVQTVLESRILHLRLCCVFMLNTVFKGYVGQMCDDMTKKPLQISSWGGNDLIIRVYERAMIRIFVQFCLKSSKIAMKKSSEVPIDVQSCSKVKDVTKKVIPEP